MDIIPLKYSEARRALVAAHKAGTPAFVAGAPGCGKSALGREVALEVTGLEPVDLRTTMIDPIDLRGLPTLAKRTAADGKVTMIATWAQPDFLPRDARVICLEELPNAPQSVQSALLQLVYFPYQLGDYKLPAGAWIMATGNRVADRAGAGRVISSLRDRFVMFELCADLNDWLAWASAAGVATEIMQFLRFKPGLLSAFDPAEDVSPTPRSWELASRLMPHVDRDIELATFSGVVGHGAAVEFCAFLQIWRQLPDPDAVLLNPDQAEIPTDPATLYALTGALASRVGPQNGGRLVRYASRLSESGAAEFSVLLVTEAIKADKASVCQTREFQTWAAAHSNVIN